MPTYDLEGKYASSRGSPYLRSRCSRAKRVGMIRLERTTPCSQSRCSSQMNYIPIKVKLHDPQIEPLCLHNRFRLTPMDIPTRWLSCEDNQTTTSFNLKFGKRFNYGKEGIRTPIPRKEPRFSPPGASILFRHPV